MPPNLTEFRSAEVFDLSESEFSVEEGTGKMRAKVRILKAGRSKNNRIYRESALREAVTRGSFNGVRMFVNHSTTPPLKRSLDDMVSAIESTTYNEAEKAIDADVVFFRKDFYEFANHAKDFMGDSINSLVQGTRKPIGHGRVEEDIHRIVQPHSVDWVIFPGAGGQILAFEGEGEQMIDWSAITAAELKEHAKAVYDAIATEAVAAVEPERASADGETGTSLTQEQIDAIVDRVVAEKLEAHSKERDLIISKQTEAARQVREAFSKSGLPEKTKARTMRAFEGIQEYSEEAVASAITEAKEELAAAGAGFKITGQGPSTSTDKVAAGAFSVKESVDAFFGVKKTATGSDASGGAK